MSCLWNIPFLMLQMGIPTTLEDEGIPGEWISLLERGHKCPHGSYRVSGPGLADSGKIDIETRDPSGEVQKPEGGC